MFDLYRSILEVNTDFSSHERIHILVFLAGFLLCHWNKGIFPRDFISPRSFWSYDLVFSWHLSPNPGSCLFIWSFLRSGLFSIFSESTKTSSSLIGFTWCWILILNMKSWVRLQTSSASRQGGFIILWPSLLWVLVLMFGHLWILLLLSINLHMRYSKSQKKDSYSSSLVHECIWSCT